MFTYGSLGFGILAVVVPLVLHRVKRVEIPIFLSMAFGMVSLTCVSTVMGLSAQAGDGSMFYDTAPTFMYCSITLLVLVLAVNGWLLWKASRAKRVRKRSFDWTHRVVSVGPLR